MKLRQEVQESLKWDLSRLFENEEQFKQAVEKGKKQTGEIVETFKDSLQSPETIINCL